MTLELSSIQSRISNAVTMFCQRDIFLLEKGLNERSVVHKLASYIQQFFPDHDVDCEYNRMYNDKGEYEAKKFSAGVVNYVPKKAESKDTRGTTVYPDIIIHKRGENTNNLLVIEIKKQEYAKKTIKKINKTYREVDCEKIKLYLYNGEDLLLGYAYGLYLEFTETSLCCEESKRFSNTGIYKRDCQ